MLRPPSNFRGHPDSIRPDFDLLLNASRRSALLTDRRQHRRAAVAAAAVPVYSSHQERLVAVPCRARNAVAPPRATDRCTAAWRPARTLPAGRQRPPIRRSIWTLPAAGARRNIWWMILPGAAIGSVAIRGGRVAWVGVALLTGFLAWSAIGLSWTESTERTVAELARVAMLLGVLGLASQGRVAARHAVNGAALRHRCGGGRRGALAPAATALRAQGRAPAGRRAGRPPRQSLATCSSTSCGRTRAPRGRTSRT